MFTYIVIDDALFIFSDEFMQKINQKGYTKFNNIGEHIWQLIRTYKNIREDMTIYFMWHPEEDTNAMGTYFSKGKMLGKLISNLFSLEGLFTIVLFSEIQKTESGWNHVFIHKSNPENTAKSPPGMFPDGSISNDLTIVSKAMEKYYA